MRVSVPIKTANIRGMFSLIVQDAYKRALIKTSHNSVIFVSYRTFCRPVNKSQHTKSVHHKKCNAMMMTMQQQCTKLQHIPRNPVIQINGPTAYTRWLSYAIISYT